MEVGRPSKGMTKAAQLIQNNHKTIKKLSVNKCIQFEEETNIRIVVDVLFGFIPLCF